jgi:PMC2NT (NUC016) domain
LPSIEALNFYRKGTSLKNKIDDVNLELKTQMRLLTSLINPKKGPVGTTASQNIRFDDIVDYLDDVGENIGLSLDKTKTKGKQISTMLGSKRSLHMDITNQDVITREDDLKKPQLYFEPRPDNSEVH